MGLISSAIRWLMSILILLCISKSHAQNKVFDIMQFGGQLDGLTDNSKALSMAWDNGCKYNGHAVVLIPRGRFLVYPVMLQGPCKDSIQLQIDGEVLAPTGEPFATGEYWLAIHKVNNLVVEGKGWLDGQGPSAWPFNRCRTLGICHGGLPVTFHFSQINNANIRNIKSINSKFFHFKVFESYNILFDNVTFIAPENSPNTDGIHISMSTNINITNSFISTGDDCISLGPGSKVIHITNVQCGPGHGISIGSLGQFANESDVTGITVRDSIFKNTKNGVRIKSWSTPCPSTVSNIAFINLEMNNVEQPIIIDQSYCPHDSCYRNYQMSKSRVRIEDVKYEGIRGTSSRELAVNFDCSQITPCQGLVLKDINITLNNGGTVTSRCWNVKGSTFGLQSPPSCF